MAIANLRNDIDEIDAVLTAALALSSENETVKTLLEHAKSVVEWNIRGELDDM